jgi:eukaryotic-like serine/threonine-protein kinase
MPRPALPHFLSALVDGRCFHPQVVGNIVYIGSHSGRLIAIDRIAKEQEWTFQTDQSRQSASTFTKPNGTPEYSAAFSSNFYDDMIVGVDRMLHIGAILSSPVVVDQVIYVGSSDSNLYALM